MLQNSSKLARCQKVVQSIREDMLIRTPKKPTTSRLLKAKKSVTEQSPVIEYVPLPENPQLDAMMDNIKRILAKHKKQPSGELKNMLSTQVKSKRHMIEVRFKEFYNSRIASPQPEVVVDVSPCVDSKSSRLIQYQRRIGLIKKRDPLEERIQEIGQRRRTKQ